MMVVLFSNKEGAVRDTDAHAIETTRPFVQHAATPHN
jgi:hypothetical protein